MLTMPSQQPSRVDVLEPLAVSQCTLAHPAARSCAATL
jgi:hypothetical protein